MDQRDFHEEQAVRDRRADQLAGQGLAHRVDSYLHHLRFGYQRSSRDGTGSDAQADTDPGHKSTAIFGRATATTENSQCRAREPEVPRPETAGSTVVATADVATSFQTAATTTAARAPAAEEAAATAESSAAATDSAKEPSRAAAATAAGSAFPTSTQALQERTRAAAGATAITTTDLHSTANAPTEAGTAQFSASTLRSCPTCPRIHRGTRRSRVLTSSGTEGRTLFHRQFPQYGGGRGLAGLPPMSMPPPGVVPVPVGIEPLLQMVHRHIKDEVMEQETPKFQPPVTMAPPHFPPLTMHAGSGLGPGLPLMSMPPPGVVPMSVGEPPMQPQLVHHHIKDETPRFQGVPENKKIFLDGKAYEVFYLDDLAVIERNGLPHRVSFTGPPRDVIIDGQPYRMAFGQSQDVLIDGQKHTLRFGAPSRELYMGSFPFKGAFGGPPIVNGRRHEIRLCGPPPEVKIDPEPSHELARHMPALYPQHLFNVFLCVYII